METLDSVLILAKRSLLEILTVLWILWFAVVALGAVICTISSCLNRRNLAKLKQRYELARLSRDEGAVPFNLDLERLKDTLVQREAELRDDAERMGLDFGLQAVLENFRGKIEEKLADLPATQQDLLTRLKYIHQALHDFKYLCVPEQLTQARLALKRGETTKAAALLKRAQFLVNQQVAEAGGSQFAVARGKKFTAAAAFLLGQLAETDFNYFSATQYYQLAADLEPVQLTYLNAAAELSYAFGELHETGSLLEQVLRIQEKLLGPEHVELAPTLNNLAVLRHTQGRDAEAEAFYQWALEICAANLSSHDQDMVNLVQNYTAFLKEVGRQDEADRFQSQAAMA